MSFFKHQKSQIAQYQQFAIFIFQTYFLAGFKKSSNFAQDFKSIELFHMVQRQSMFNFKKLNHYESNKIIIDCIELYAHDWL